MNNQLSCISCLSPACRNLGAGRWLKSIRVYLCSSVVPKLLSVYSFVVETKSTLFTDALRPTEKAKIACGREHFKALGKEVEFAVTNAFEDFSGKYAN